MERSGITFVYRKDRQGLLRDARSGRAPDDLLYGYRHLAGLGAPLNMVAPDETEVYWQKTLLRPLENRLAARLGMGFFLDFALRHLGRLRRAGALVSVVDTMGLPLAMLKSLGLLRTPLIYICQGLSDRLEQAPSSPAAAAARRLYPRWLAAAERVLTLGVGAARDLERVFGWPEGRVGVLPFGVDADFWRPGQAGSGGGVLSVGSDLGRDYPTLLLALQGLPLHVVTRQDLDLAPATGQVTTGSAYSDAELRALYQGADLVVTPLRDVAQPSGQSATLQAMACGKAVVLTRTRGLWAPEHMTDGLNCLLVPPGDPEALHRAMARLRDDPGLAARLGREARRTVEERFTSAGMARAWTAELAGLKIWNPA